MVAGAAYGAQPVSILSGITGHAGPGEVLAIMGPSGCGKTTLLDTLAERRRLPNLKNEALTKLNMSHEETWNLGRLGPGITETGSILINGRREKLAFGTSSKLTTGCCELNLKAYVTQDSVLMSTMSVREAIYYSAQLQLPGTMPAAEKRAHAGAGIREFFTESGFPCPPLRNPSDHFLRTINKDFDEEIVESSKARRKTAAEAIEILTDAYQSPAYSEKTMDRIAEMKGIGGAPFRKREQASFSTKLFVLTRRSFVNMHRDIGYYWMRLGVYLGIGICLGTIFYQVGHSYSSIQARCEVIMYTTALLTFMAIGGFPSFVEDVFRRERLSGHYGVAEFVISNTLSATPYLAVIAVIPGAMLYYLTGLTKGPDRFAYFVVNLCMCTLLVESMMMIIAVIVPDFLMGIIVGAGVQGVMMLNGGFFRLPNELPKPVWKYPCYYISFHKYAVQGFYKNEFIGQTFPSDQLVEKNVTISGLRVLQEKLQVEMGYSKWVNIAILCGMMVLYRVMFFAIVKIAEEVRPKLRGMRCKLCK
uniref:ABC transporter G family member 11 n=1 Tax=Aegilops tauschii TaxID=37682 RepID=M8C413_AEGTA